MKKLNLLPALVVLAAFTACGESDPEETTYVEPAPTAITAPAVTEAPAPIVQEPLREEMEAPVERAAEPATRPVNARYALMPDEMRYRNMDQGYTAEDFERMGIEIKDDIYGTDRY